VGHVGDCLPSPDDQWGGVADEVVRLRGELADERAANKLMSAQFRTMQAEKEHGWQQADELRETVEEDAAKIHVLHTAWLAVADLCRRREAETAPLGVPTLTVEEVRSALIGDSAGAADE
jgi:hypothetical protein